MLIPTKSEAEHLLALAGRLNPGPWVEHSLYTGRAAQAIAIKAEIESAMGTSIYKLLPGVVENTFPELSSEEDGP